MGFTDTSLVWRLAFFVSLVGFVLTLGGLSSTYMVDTELIPNMWMHLGMWDICDDTRSFSCQSMEEYLIGIQDDSDWLYGSRAMAVIGIILLGFIPLISLYLTYTASSDQVASLIIGALDLVAAIFCCIGVAIFVAYGEDLLETAAEMYAQPSWSFILYMLGQLCAVCSSIMNFYDACSENTH